MNVKKIAKGTAGLVGLVSLGALGLGISLMGFNHREAKLNCNIKLLSQVGLKDYFGLEKVSNIHAETFKYKQPSPECESHLFTEDRYNFGDLSTCDYDLDGRIDRAFCTGSSDGA